MMYPELLVVFHESEHEFKEAISDQVSAKLRVLDFLHFEDESTLRIL